MQEEACNYVYSITSCLIKDLTITAALRYKIMFKIIGFENIRFNIHILFDGVALAIFVIHVMFTFTCVIKETGC